MLWSHDVRCGVLCFHVVWLVWLVEWCVGCLAGWVLWQLGLFVGCLAGWGMLCGVCTLRCLVPYVTCAVVCCVFMLCGWCGWLNGVLVAWQVGFFGSLGYLLGF